MKNIQGGFTLVEAMIAVSILTLAVAGPLFSADRAIVAAMLARDQLTASYLAQEGIEYMRAMRDTVYLYDRSRDKTSLAWIDFLNTTGANVTGNIGICRDAYCIVDPTVSMDIALQQCPGSGCAPLYLAPTKLYTQNSSGGTATSFRRSIQVISASPDPVNDVRIISTVKWTYHNTEHEVKITDHLTPWQ